MAQHSTDYWGTFIVVADDCPADHAVERPYSVHFRAMRDKRA